MKHPQLTGNFSPLSLGSCSLVSRQAQVWNRHQSHQKSSEKIPPVMVQGRGWRDAQLIFLFSVITQPPGSPHSGQLGFSWRRQWARGRSVHSGGRCPLQLEAVRSRMPVLSHIFFHHPLLTPHGPGYGHSPRKYTAEHSNENPSLWPKTKRKASQEMKDQRTQRRGVGK